MVFAIGNMPHWDYWNHSRLTTDSKRCTTGSPRVQWWAGFPNGFSGACWRPSKGLSGVTSDNCWLGTTNDCSGVCSIAYKVRKGGISTLAVDPRHLLWVSFMVLEHLSGLKHILVCSKWHAFIVFHSWVFCDPWPCCCCHHPGLPGCGSSEKAMSLRLEDPN